jgi:hypothetical protein
MEEARKFFQTMWRACRMLSFGVGEAVIELSIQSYSTGTYCKSVFMRTFSAVSMEIYSAKAS